MKRLSIAFLCFALTGCAASTSVLMEKPFVNPEYGMTKRQLVELLGRPRRIEVYQKFNQTRVEFYIYARKYGSRQQPVPVCLIDNKVAGWGKTYYEDHLSPDDIRIK